MPILQLPPSVVNKIAAGEVIERPASVVKELVENALDAGSTRIDVSIEQGGIDLVRVVDNGGGIPPEELPLAIASHATSKLRTADDLFQVRTMGFRGEALASIAEVSRFVLRSRTPEADAGAELSVVGGVAADVVPASHPPGTTVEVRNLFFNTPVRRKFLRNTQTEMGHIGEAFTRLAIAHPHVQFSLRHNQRGVYDLPPSADWLERLRLFFGAELADDLLWVESEDSGVRLSGYVAKPTQSRSQPRMQYLFLNGRFIRDRALQHALQEAYRGLLLTGRYPISFLRIDMPPDLVDVNVHPTKMEVRFQDGSRLYSQLLGTLRTKFLTSDLNHRLTPVAEPSAGAEEDRDRRRQELVDWARSQIPALDRTMERDSSETVSLAGQNRPGTDEQEASEFSYRHQPLRLEKLDEPAAVRPLPPVTSVAREMNSSAPPPVALVQPRSGAYPKAIQLHNRYLIAETDEGMVVIDQHALHERVLYEKFRETALAGGIESQALLVPEPVDLSPREAALALEHRNTFAHVGLRVEPFGGDTVLVNAVPAMLRSLRPAELLRGLIDQLAAGGKIPERRDVLDELLHMMACKAAIKAGDPLTPDEIDALLAQRDLAQDTHHCPHGRPTALVFTREELDKQFMRI